MSWDKVWLLPFKYLLTKKVREVLCKVIQWFYPAKSFFKDINRIFKLSVLSVKMQRKMFPIYFGTVLILRVSLCLKDVFFGVFDFREEKKGLYFITNLLFFLANYHIHKMLYSALMIYGCD